MPRRLRPLVALLPIVLAACDSGGEPASAFLEFRGASTYVRTLAVEGESGPLSVDTVDVSVVTGGASLGDEHDLTEVVAASRSMGIEERAWYRVTDTSLDHVAYQCPGLGMIPTARRAGPRTSLSQPLPHPASEARQACDRAPVVRDDPFVVYRLPLRTGASWQSSPYPFRTERTVTGTQTVGGPLGRVTVSVIQTRVYADAAQPLPITWTDYVSEDAGLMRRVFAVEQDRMSEEGVVMGRFTSVERFERIR